MAKDDADGPPSKDDEPRVTVPEDDIDIPGVGRPGRRATIVAVVAVLAAGGAGYYAWTLRAEVGSLSQSRHELGLERTKTTELGEQLAACQKERDEHKSVRADTEKAAADAQATLSATRTDLEEAKRERAEADARLGAFKSIMAKFQKMIDTGKLKVMIRDGRMIVKLPAEIFFASGKAELAKDAAPALREIASILRQFPDRRFEVAGHTDNVPLHTAQFKSNWELSTARAVTVTEALAAGGMNPTNLVAAGYGPYDPVANNKSEPGRKENRRIEIALLPNIKELPALPADALPAPAPSAPASASAAPAASGAPPK